MGSTIEQKMLQAIIFTFEIIFSALSGLLENVVIPKCKVKDLHEFLNKTEYKHMLFHLHNHDLPCCECPPRFKRKAGQVLRKDQFDILFFNTGRKNRHLKSTQNGVITQECLCRYDVQHGVSLNNFDITLLVTIIRNCGKGFFSQNEISWLDDIRNKRNFVFHASNLNSFEEPVLDNLLQELEHLVLKISGLVPFQSFQTCIKTQISLLKSTTIQQEGARNIIANTERIIESEKTILIDIINGKTKQLEVKMDSLHNETLHYYREGTQDIKTTIDTHFDDNKRKQDNETLQIKQRIDAMEKNVKDDHEAMSSDIKTHTNELYKRQSDKSEDIKTELKDNQEMIKKTQVDHTFKLISIEHISENVLHTTTETKEEQSKQTSVIATIQSSVEKLKEKGLDEDDKEGLRKLKDTFSKIKNIAEVLRRDGECQTDTENMQFELGEHSKQTVLECVRTATDSIQMTIKDLMESLERHYNADNMTRHEIVQKVKKILQGVDVGCQTEFELTANSKTVLEDIQTWTDNIQTQNIHMTKVLDSIQSGTDNIDKRNTHVATMMRCIETRTDKIQTQNAVLQTTLNAVLDRTETLEQKLETGLNQKVESVEDTNYENVLKLIKDHICGNTEIWNKHIFEIHCMASNSSRYYVERLGQWHLRGMSVKIFEELKEAINSQLLIFQSHIREHVDGKCLTTGRIQQMTNSICLEMTKTLQNSTKSLVGVKLNTHQCDVSHMLYCNAIRYFDFCENCISEYVFDFTEMAMAFPHNTHNSTHSSVNAFNLFLELSIMRAAVDVISGVL